MPKTSTQTLTSNLGLISLSGSFDKIGVGRWNRSGVNRQLHTAEAAYLRKLGTSDASLLAFGATRFQCGFANVPFLLNQVDL